MKKLQINANQARDLYENGSPKFKKQLIEFFGSYFFSDDITDRVKTIDDAISILDDNDIDVLELKKMTAAQIKGNALYYQQAKIITKVLNEDWVPDWSNNRQEKFSIGMQYKEGSGLADTTVDYWVAYTSVGSRLCFASNELAAYAAKQFYNIYLQLFN